MSFRTDILPVVDATRAIAGPDGLDVRTSKLTIITRTWSGGRAGMGTYSDASLELPQHYKLKDLSSKEIAGSGGRYQQNDIRVGPITPAYSSGGYTPAQLAPAGDNGVEVLYQITGPDSGMYSLVECCTDAAFHYSLVLRRRRTTP